MKTKRIPSINSRFRIGDTVKVLRNIYRLPSNFVGEARVEELYVAEGTEGVIVKLITGPTYGLGPVRHYAVVKAQDRLLTLRLTSIAHT